MISKSETFFLTAGIFFSAMLLFNLHASGQKSKTHTLTADEAKLVKKDAGTMFSSGDYNGALKSYRDLVKSDPKNQDYNYKLGVCLLLTNNPKSNAFEYLEMSSKGKDVKKDTWYFLGLGYMHAGKWNQAVEAFNQSKANNFIKPGKDFVPVDRLIEMCENGKKLVTTPIDVTFENLGKLINTPFEEYNPFISADEKTLVFTSRRKGNMGGFIAELGIYTADVYWTQWRDTIWPKAKSVGALINTDWDEETTGLTHDGKQMFLFFDNVEAYGDIGVSMLKGRNWQKQMMMGTSVNSKSIENSGCLSNDGTVFYFGAERKEGIGGSDIWYSVKQSSGEWSAAQNIGNTINTKYDEADPFIALDGKTLFFCSRGHNSMGGYDIFYATFDSTSKQWSQPVNLGYPVNTADDELSYSMTGNGRYAYIATVRNGGLGDKDIYRVRFNNQSHPALATLVSGTITGINTTKVELRQACLVDQSTQKVTSLYKPYFVNNEYFLSAKPGNYILKIEGYGFKTIEETINVPDDSGEEKITRNYSVEIAK